MDPPYKLKQFANLNRRKYREKVKNPAIPLVIFRVLLSPTIEPLMKLLLSNKVIIEQELSIKQNNQFGSTN